MTKNSRLKSIILLTLVLFLFTLPANSFSAAPNEEVINFKDPTLEKAVREKLNKPTGKITKSEVKEVEALGTKKIDKNYKPITSLEGIQYLTNLKSLYLQNNQITNITQLKKLNKLVQLNLQGNKISNINPLAKLKKLMELNLAYNQIKNIPPLSNLTNLRVLELSYNRITDIKPLSTLNNLKYLYLKDNQIQNTKPLLKTPNLHFVDIARNNLNYSKNSEDMELLESVKTKNKVTINIKNRV